MNIDGEIRDALLPDSYQEAEALKRVRAKLEGEFPSAPTIYCFLNGGSRGWYNVMAMAEDGTVLAGHVCSSPSFFLHDIGIESNWKHEKYREHYPDGFRLEWIERDEIDDHEGLQRAFALADRPERDEP